MIPACEFESVIRNTVRRFRVTADMKIVRGLLFCVCALLIVVAAAAQSTPGCSGGSSTLKDFFNPADTARAEQFLTTLQGALTNNDRAKIAGMVQYPLRVNTKGGVHRQIRNRQQFLAQFDQLFTPATRSVVRAQVPACMFARDQGVMIGDGQIWFQDVNGTFLIWSSNLM